MAKKRITKVTKVNVDDLLLIVMSRTVRMVRITNGGIRVLPLNSTGRAVHSVVHVIAKYLQVNGYVSLADTLNFSLQMYEKHNMSRSTFYSVLFELLCSSFGYHASASSKNTLVIDLTQNFHYFNII